MNSIIDTTLLYRFFFYGWLLRDASRGSLWERAAAWNHNREQSRWLPTYLRRWGIMTVALAALGAVCNIALEQPVAAACFNVAAVLTVPYHVVTATCWWLLQRDWSGSRR